MDVFFTADERR